MEYPKISPEIKSKWTTALRSGNYKQAFGVLKDTMYGIYDTDGQFVEYDCHCALGVLGEVCGVKNLTSEAVYSDIEKLLNTQPFGTTMSKIFQLNDAQRKSFSEIADWIDQNL
jgi:hypothetical protein